MKNRINMEEFPKVRCNLKGLIPSPELNDSMLIGVRAPC